MISCVMAIVALWAVEVVHLWCTSRMAALGAEGARECEALRASIKALEKRLDRVATYGQEPIR
jgi:hypothetical protein